VSSIQGIIGFTLPIDIGKVNRGLNHQSEIYNHQSIGVCFTLRLDQIIRERGFAMPVWVKHPASLLAEIMPGYSRTLHPYVLANLHCSWIADLEYF
jgi:hypothetical protein